MKPEQFQQAHPQHPSLGRRAESHAGGGRRQPSSAFDRSDPSGDADGFSLASVPGRLLPAVGVTLGSTVALVTLLAALSLRLVDPVALITPLAWGITGLASLLGGMIAGRRMPERPAVAGGLAGAVVVAVLTLGGFLFGKATPSGWLLRLCVMALHTVGALIARPRKRAASHGDHHAGTHRRH